MISDYALAALTSVFGVLLLRLSRFRRQTAVSLWAAFFFATALAAITGGTSHGFAPYLGDATEAVLWKATLYSIGFVSFFMLSGTVVASVPAPVKQWLLGASVVKLAIYAVWMVSHDEYRYAIYDYAPALFGVLLLQVFAAYHGKTESARWIIAGVIVSFGAAGIQQSGLTLHEHFNHNDLYHVIQMGAMYLLYRGARLLRDR